MNNQEYKNILNLIDPYLSVNGVYFSRESTKYSLRNDSFMQKEYSQIINLNKKLFYLSQIEFEHILLWSCNSLKDLYQRINQIDQILDLLSFKIFS